MPVSVNSLLQHNEQTTKNSKNSQYDDEDDRALTQYLSQDRSQQIIRSGQEVASSAIIDSLSAEWWTLNLSQTVVNDLLENLLPLVVLACEKVINEADERSLVLIDKPDRSFNPINRLASFLMRNNPRYMHFSTLSPYHYSMKSLLHEKRVQVLKIYGEEETLLKSVVKQRQSDRKNREEDEKAEQQRRKDQLKLLFQKWNVPERGWIQTKLINNMVEELKEDSKFASLKPNLQIPQSHRMHLGTFTEVFLDGLSAQSSDNFDKILAGYQQFAETYTNIHQEHRIDLMFQSLFLRLDDKKSGFLLRKNVLHHLETFFKGLNDNDKQQVFPPEKWPVISKIKLPDVESTSDSENTDETTPEDRKADSLVTNEQGIVPTISGLDSDEKIDEDEGKVEIVLREPSACKAEDEIHRLLKMQCFDLDDVDYRYVRASVPSYNLEHFDDQAKIKSILFDEQLTNQAQFSALLNSFIGVNKNEMVGCALIDHFRFNYKESVEDKNNKRLILHQRQIDAQRRLQTDLLFEKLNFTCSRQLKVEPLAVILRQYKDGTQIEHIEPLLQKYQERVKLNSKEFNEFVVDLHQTLNEALGGSEKFEEIIKFLDNQVPQLSANDRNRTHTRRQWLKRLRNISYRNVDELYKEVFEILQKDSEAFGSPSTKILSVYIALIEEDLDQLKYVAATNDQTNLIGKTLKRDQGVSFQILESGKWAYVNQTKNHTRLHFFNPTMKSNPGSFVLMPIKDLESSYSAGLLAIDTIRDKKEKAFVQHEILFYEGLASTIAETLVLLKLDQNVLKVVDRFLYWINERFPRKTNVDYYYFDPTSVNNQNERTLKQVFNYSDGTKHIFETPLTINGREQVFKYYLEQAAITGQSSVVSYLGRVHFIQVLQNKDQFCFGLIDTHFDIDEKVSQHQEELLGTMNRCLSMAVDRLEQDLMLKQTKKYFQYEKDSAEKRTKFLFDRMYFKNISHKIKNIPNEKFNEFIQHKVKWNDQIKQLFVVLSQIVENKDLSLNEYDSVLVPAMTEFDPSSSESLANDQWDRAQQFLPNATTLLHGSSEIASIFSEWLLFAFGLYKLSK